MSILDEIAGYAKIRVENDVKKISHDEMKSLAKNSLTREKKRAIIGTTV